MHGIAPSQQITALQFCRNPFHILDVTITFGSLMQRLLLAAKYTTDSVLSLAVFAEEEAHAGCLWRLRYRRALAWTSVPIT
eukprot:3075762-Pleurochrysis_carterae.AAC.2